MDALEPEWKYLSCFTIKKEAADTVTGGALVNLLAPRRGSTKVIPVTSPPLIPDDSPTIQQQGELTLEPYNDSTDDAASQPPADTVPPAAQQGPLPDTGTSVSVARQTRSGRVVGNTSRNEQSIMQRDQGLVAWEVLLDQDEHEQVPTAASQYKLHKSLENPLVFAASDNPDILYWNQAMKAHDSDTFVEAVGAQLDGHEKMGNYEPVPLNQVPRGTKIIDMVWSMRCDANDRSRHKKCTSRKSASMCMVGSKSMAFTTGTPTPQ